MFSRETLSALVRRFVAAAPQRRVRLAERRQIWAECQRLEERRLFSDATAGYTPTPGSYVDYNFAEYMESSGPGDDMLIAQANPFSGCSVPDCPPRDSTENPVSYFSGKATLSTADLWSDGFGKGWGHVRSWQDTYDGPNGHGWVLADMPHALAVSPTEMAIVGSGSDHRWFDLTGGVWVARGASRDTLQQGTDELVFTDSSGNRTTFYDYGSSGAVTDRRGQVKEYLDADGTAIAFTYEDSDANSTLDRLQEMTRSATAGTRTVKESLLYTYVSGGANDGLVASVTLRRKAWDSAAAADPGKTEGGTSYATVRSADYAYYDGSTNADKGLARHLQTVTIRDGAGAAIDRTHYRYYVADAGTGYTGAIKYVLGGDAYARAAAGLAAGTVEDAADGDVDQYADNYFEYDGDRRVSQEVARGAGCSSCTGGQGTYSLTYTDSGNGDGYNTWKRKTVVTLPDGNTKTVYTNFAGQAMLSVVEDSGGNRWGTFYKYDDAGRQIWKANPSAVDLSPGLATLESYPDLLNDQSGNYQYLRDSAGLIEVTTYYGSTTATTSTAGGVEGYVNQTALRRGDNSTDILQSTTTYIERSVSGRTAFPVAGQTVYRNENATGGQTTTYAYAWYSGTLQPQSVTVTLPTVTTAQNGPNVAVTETTQFDPFGRATWHRVEDGAGLENFIDYTGYDDATGAVVTRISDVNASLVSDEPAGWTTPAGGGLHLTTTVLVDGLGRVTKVTDPNGNVTYTVYRDAQHEVRTYRGWTGSATTGPTEVVRQVRPAANSQRLVFVESLTSTATPATSSGAPTGAEAVTDASVQSLARSFTNDAGQVLWTDAYFSTAGLSAGWLAGTVPLSSGEPDNAGAEGTNYHRTRYAFDDRGRQNKVDNAVRTITRTVYDVLGRAVGTWVGTNDAGATNYDPDGSGGSNNMKQVAAYEYDGGAAGGDSNLTKVTAVVNPANAALNRVTQYAYDWRNREVATKGGVEGSETANDNRHPITHRTLDNLGQATLVRGYDGDTLSVTADANSDGVPDAPASALRSYATYAYDEWGSAYEVATYAVDPSSGSVGNAVKSQVWRDKRGNAIKQASPGGLVSKTQFDGAGRVTKSFATDGGGDAGWSDADDVTGDKVLEQVAYAYDANGNVVLTTAKQRFHDEAGTGELGTYNAGVKARVSYAASYYDAVDRLTATADVGTNPVAGVPTAYTRPGTVAARSDAVLVTSYTYDAAGRLLEEADPKNLKTRYAYDLLGRTLSVTENYVDGTPADADDRVTAYTYDGLGRAVTMTADLPSGQNDQVTQYVYGVTVAGGSDVNSNDLLLEVRYPNPSTGAAGTTAALKEQYTRNAAGQAKTLTDRNGNAHTYSYDVLGRLTTDAVTTLGAGVDGGVRRQEVAYDTQGQAYLFTQHTASAGGTVVNQVQREFNGFGQLKTEWQAVGGSVNTGTSPKVQYAYTEAAGGANHSRLTTVTYPNGRKVRYEYAAGLDGSISRLSYLADDASGSVGTHVEELSYLGLGTIVERNHPEPGLNLTYVGTGTADAGDKYVGLDRFGRVADHRWVDARDAGTTDDRDADRFGYTYDRNSNRLTRDWSSFQGQSGFDEAYTYDSFDRLTKVNRGNLASGTITDANATWAQQWDNTGSTGSGLDAVGNWKAVTTDTNGGTAGGTTTQTRGHDAQNRLTSVSGATAPTYDDAGNMESDEDGQQLVYDAWNRTVKVKTSGGTDKATYTLDALGRRVARVVGAGGVGNSLQFYYSDGWQVLEERELIGGTYQPRWQNVWSPAYVDALAARDTVDPTAAGALDTTFDSDGKLTINASASIDAIRFVEQADGKLVGAGVANGHLFMARVNADGSLDASFDGPSGTGNGWFRVTLGTSSQALGLAVQPDGKIVIVGNKDNDVLVGRFNADGSWDTAFDGPGGAGNGNFALDYSGATDQGWGVAVQKDGKIVLTGVSGGDVLVARLNATGTYDTSFDTDGWRKDNLTGTDIGRKVVLDHDGKAVVVGDTTAGGAGGDVIVHRYTTAGALDTTFDTDGKVQTSLSAGQDTGRDVDVDDKNRVLVAAYGDGNLDAIRYTTAGALDTSFDADGKVSVDVNGTDQAENVAVDQSGRVILSGSSNGQKQFAVARLTEAGAADTAFDADGEQTVDLAASGTATEIGYAMVVQQDGRVVLAGLADTDVGVARLSNGGARHYVVQDANYNVTAVADAAGAVVDRYQYEAYGKQAVLNGDFSADADGNGDVYVAFGFQGLRYDGNSGNWHARHRDLDPGLGRWTQQDPAGYPDGTNRYAFVSSTPTGAVDPSGLEGEGLVFKVEGARVGSTSTVGGASTQTLDLAPTLWNKQPPGGDGWALKGQLTLTNKSDSGGTQQTVSGALLFDDYKGSSLYGDVFYSDGFGDQYSGGNVLAIGKVGQVGDVTGSVLGGAGFSDPAIGPSSMYGLFGTQLSFPGKEDDSTWDLITKATYSEYGDYESWKAGAQVKYKAGKGKAQTQFELEFGIEDIISSGQDDQYSYYLKAKAKCPFKLPDNPYLEYVTPYVDVSYSSPFDSDFEKRALDMSAGLNFNIKNSDWYVTIGAHTKLVGENLRQSSDPNDTYFGPQIGFGGAPEPRNR